METIRLLSSSEISLTRFSGRSSAELGPCWPRPEKTTALHGRVRLSPFQGQERRGDGKPCRWVGKTQVETRARAGAGCGVCGGALPREPGSLFLKYIFLVNYCGTQRTKCRAVKARGCWRDAPLTRGGLGTSRLLCIAAPPVCRAGFNASSCLIPASCQAALGLPLKAQTLSIQLAL